MAFGGGAAATGARGGARGDATAAPTAVNVLGTWDFTLAIPGNESSGTLELTGTPETLAGRMSGPVDAPLQDVTLTGNTLTASVDADGRTYRVTLTFAGDTFTGVSESGPLSAPVRGTRRPN